ncbi:hypothetical protein LTS18_000603, partial [Coniosporium uncinatum]
NPTATSISSSLKHHCTSPKLPANFNTFLSEGALQRHKLILPSHEHTDVRGGEQGEDVRHQRQLARSAATALKWTLAEIERLQEAA